MTRNSSIARLQSWKTIFSGLAESLGGSKNPLYLLYDRLKAEGVEIVDLIRGNVNEHGIVYPPEMLDQILKDAAAQSRIYMPDSLGQRPAREAIAEYYKPLNISADQVL